jgi:hypothetical protein
LRERREGVSGERVVARDTTPSLGTSARFGAALA